MLKSCFMLTEAFYGLQSEEVHGQIHDIVLGQMFQTLDASMNSLNADILGLNNTLKTDSLQLVKENPLVQSIMARIDIITSFIRMTYRVLEKLSIR